MAVMTAGQVAALAREAGWTTPADIKTVVAIAYDESKFNTEAVGGPNSNGSFDYGLMQINSIHKPTQAEKKQPRANMLRAYKIYKVQGFKAWATYNKGLSNAAKKQGDIGYTKIAENPEYADKVVNQEKSPTVELSPLGVVSKATDSITSALFKLGINLGAGVLAVILLVLGVVILSRVSAGKVAKTALKVVK